MRHDENGRLFQSTLPVKGATYALGALAHAYAVSIHAPGEGSDITDDCVPVANYCFNPRSR